MSNVFSRACALFVVVGGLGMQLAHRRRGRAPYRRQGTLALGLTGDLAPMELRITTLVNSRLDL